MFHNGRRGGVVPSSTTCHGNPRNALVGLLAALDGAAALIQRSEINDTVDDHADRPLLEQYSVLKTHRTRLAPSGEIEVTIREQVTDILDFLENAAFGIFRDARERVESSLVTVVLPKICLFF